MLRTGTEHLESLRDGRVVYVGKERIDDVTTHPAFRNGAHTMAAIYDAKCDPAEHRPVVRGSRRTLLDVFPQGAHPGRPRAPHARPQAHRRHDPGPLRPLARSRRQLRDGVHVHAGGVRRGPQGLRTEHRRLLRAPAPQRPLLLLRGAAAAGGAQPRVLPRPRARGAHAARGARGGRRRRDQRHEDARLGRRVRQRTVDRQHPSDRAGAEGRIDHLRHPDQFAGPQAVVAPAVRAPRGVAVRLAARVGLRRDRQHGDLRGSQGPVGARVRARRPGALAQHLHHHAGAQLQQPPVQRAVLVQARLHRRPGEQGHGSHRRIEAAGGAGGARPARRAGVADARHGAGAVARLRVVGGRAVRGLQPPARVFDTAVVRGELLADHRRPARTLRRRRIPDAGGLVGDRGSGLARDVRELLAHAAALAAGSHEALQARLGVHRFRVRRPPSRVREVLRRRFVHPRMHNHREAPWRAFDERVEKFMAGYDAPGAQK